MNLVVMNHRRGVIIKNSWNVFMRKYFACQRNQRRSFPNSTITTHHKFQVQGVPKIKARDFFVFVIGLYSKSNLEFVIHFFIRFFFVSVKSSNWISINCW
eukprot:Lithocolla_globosa_v1_NODE_1846_length_2299_cov_5.458556.p2 type:complete len:100 gc:universal NODE_1846_length_2299_cov_5.458556:1890-1591(-)